MKISQLGTNPLLHSAMSNIGIAPRLDDAKNALTLTEPKFKALLAALSAVAVDSRDLPSLVATKKRNLQELVEAEMEKVEGADTKTRNAVYERHRTRTFRVLVATREHQSAHREAWSFEYKRYVVKYNQNRQDPDSLGTGVSAHYVVRIAYTLVHLYKSRRNEGGAFLLETSCNASAVDGESGSPFASSMFKLQPHEWEAKLADVYIQPYRILELVASFANSGRSLHRLLRVGQPLTAPQSFSLGLTDREMRESIKVQTFGFRWMMVLKYKDKDPRRLLLLLLYVLYNSKHRFLDRDVGVSKVVRVAVEMNRGSDKEHDVFGLEAPRVENDFDEPQEVDPMESRIGQALESQKRDPVVSLRLKVMDTQRRNLYAVSMHVPSLRYLQLLYRMTDGVNPTVEDERGRLRDAWKEMAKYGIVLGVDAYSGYLGKQRHIHTLNDLIALFVNEYKRDIQRFCQKILDSSYKALDLDYWMSLRWLQVMGAGLPSPAWKWLEDNPTKNIVELMVKQRVLKNVPEVDGVLTPNKEQMRVIKDEILRWRSEYGYDPTYTYGAHAAVIRAWYSIDDPRAFHEAERKGIPLSEKVKTTQRFLTTGTGAWLPRLMLMPRVTTLGVRK